MTDRWKGKGREGEKERGRTDDGLVWCCFDVVREGEPVEAPGEMLISIFDGKNLWNRVRAYESSLYCAEMKILVMR